MILIAYGTRPELIKLLPIINEFEKNNISFKTLFTGQHKDIISYKSDYSIDIENTNTNRLDSIISRCLNLPEYFFDGVTHILIQGDTSSVVGLALSAMNRKIKIIHLEAGLRTYDYENPYPEEYNRRIVSSIADIHLCPTSMNRDNLLKENIDEKKIFVVGNTVLDNLLHLKKEISYENKILITLHRRENHDTIDKWFGELEDIAQTYSQYEFILPIHPNPNVNKHKNILKTVRVINPLSHDDLLILLTKCKLVITDSGGLQEECSFLNKKCLVCRKVTERPESLETTSFLVENYRDLKMIFKKHIDDFKVIDSICPFGDGESSKRISEILKKLI